MPPPAGTMATLVRSYWDALKVPEPREGVPELEVRFGGVKGYKRLSGADSDRVVARLRSLGFSLSAPEHILRMSETAPGRGQRARAEVLGLREISRFCETNQFRTTGDKVHARFESKGHLGKGPVDNREFEFRVSLQREKELPASSRLVRDMLARWSTTEKYYRYLNRVSLRSEQFPVRVDVSAVKSGRGRTLVDSGIPTRGVSHEIEVEVEGDRVGPGTPHDTPASVEAVLRRVITYVLQGVQGTNYPISGPQQEAVLKQYAEVVGASYSSGRPMRSWAFAGPSSVTLQVDNIAPPNPAVSLPNVREGYTVTDKADGQRKLLYVGDGGRVYLITTNMQVQYAGAVASSSLKGTILDGEHISLGKNKEHINLYAAFDVYWNAGKETRGLPFVAAAGQESRLSVLSRVVAAAELQGASAGKPSPMRLQAKTFEVQGGSRTIFDACSSVLKRESDGLYEYETDGLIFTPTGLSVGALEVGSPPAPAKKATWRASFKWKPPDQNTIDFLVIFKKDPDSGKDLISNLFQAGTNVGVAAQLSQYKTAILCVGHDTRNADANPCQLMLEGQRALGAGSQLQITGLHDGDTYQPRRFFPTQPYDPKAGDCNVMLTAGPGGEKIALAESDEVIEDQSIVEFRYDPDREGSWRWVPLRVRHDKTAELRGGGRNYGNDEKVANSNWRSLHNPVTADMLATGLGIPDELAEDEVYYNRKGGTSQTRGLRDFHNKYVKNRLIVGLSKPGGTLVDMAVGKAGDLPKWTDSGASFVMGLDINRDNIHNTKDGACARYLRYKKSVREVPGALFLQGDASRNVRGGEAFPTQKGKALAAAIFGRGPKSKSKLEPMVYDAYGVAEKGFGTCSMQFALHYVWSTPQELQGFIRNVAEVTKEGGHFVGTCYNGESIFRLLAGKKEGESAVFAQDGVKLCEITKRYDRDTYSPDSSCIGYAIDVYQESINKTFREYLVNPAYLSRLMEDYGFVPLTEEEYKEAGLPASLGGFRMLFGQMVRQETQKRRSGKRFGAAAQMSALEKEVSFLNMFFVYKKVRAVDARQTMYGLLGDSLSSEARTELQGEKARVVDAAVKAGSESGSMKKTGRKVRLRLKKASHQR